MELKVGDHVSALRSHNKAVRLTGTIESIGETEPILTMRLDENPDWLETVHIEDVTVLPPVETEESSRSSPCGSTKIRIGSKRCTSKT